MVKTNSKIAIENIKNYIINNFDGVGYTETPPESWEEIAKFIYNTFRSEKYNRPEDFRYYHNKEYLAFIDWCQGLPSVLDTCYYYNRSAIDDLGEILEETEKEKARYTEEQAETKLTYLIYTAIVKGAKK